SPERRHEDAQRMGGECSSYRRLRRALSLVTDDAAPTSHCFCSMASVARRRSYVTQHTLWLTWKGPFSASPLAPSRRRMLGVWRCARRCSASDGDPCRNRGKRLELYHLQMSIRQSGVFADFFACFDPAGTADGAAGVGVVVDDVAAGAATDCFAPLS